MGVESVLGEPLREGGFGEGTGAGGVEKSVSRIEKLVSLGWLDAVLALVRGGSVVCDFETCVCLRTHQPPRS